MDRAEVSALAHRWHPIAAPISEENARLLIRWLEVPAHGRVLDLGCGFGEWLLAAVGPVPTAHGVGIDISDAALAEARARAARRALTSRVTFAQADAATWTGGTFDTVICVGASHVFGGLGSTLTAVRRHLRPGGRLLLGDGFWETEPTDAALAALGAAPGELPTVGELVAQTVRQGFEPGHGHISTVAEWDDYEWAWTGALATWALTEAADDDRAEALQIARNHRREWLEGYRGQLGFVTVVLHDLGQR
jgi:cyclopropane fatty-acyl-phospholipid synthase-like methyltransferase